MYYHLTSGEVPWVLSSRGLQTTTLATKMDGNDGKAEHLEYIAFALVPIFFIMGLLGILICHILKKKGYRCTTEAEEIEEEKIDEKIEMNETIHENSDTVGQIVNYIMKNEANADVLKAMVADSSVFEPESPLSPTSPESPVSPGTPLSPGVVPFRHSCKAHHFHTVGGVVEKDVCTRCSHKRWHLIKPAQKSKENRRSRIGEVTVLSVGRFRVTKVDHKSNSKERKSLMSVTGVESVNGEMPATPAKQDVELLEEDCLQALRRKLKTPKRCILFKEMSSAEAKLIKDYVGLEQDKEKEAEQFGKHLHPIWIFLNLKREKGKARGRQNWTTWSICRNETELLRQIKTQEEASAASPLSKAGVAKMKILKECHGDEANQNNLNKKQILQGSNRLVQVGKQKAKSRRQEALDGLSPSSPTEFVPVASRACQTHVSSGLGQAEPVPGSRDSDSPPGPSLLLQEQHTEGQTSCASKEINKSCFGYSDFKQATIDCTIVIIFFPTTANVHQVAAITRQPLPPDDTRSVNHTKFSTVQIKHVDVLITTGHTHSVRETQERSAQLWASQIRRVGRKLERLLERPKSHGLPRETEGSGHIQSCKECTSHGAPIQLALFLKFDVIQHSLDHYKTGEVGWANWKSTTDKCSLLCGLQVKDVKTFMPEDEKVSLLGVQKHPHKNELLLAISANLWGLYDTAVGFKAGFLGSRV
ncbi:hypothetical protein IHE44_0012954 [Lamprotornis superbus]|uniref:RELL1 protein n=1 Tax=Lamprotornis superbus TaxID=245042 RepID=A0A835NUF7_9PASS|nr:hypothetical protein IHE44_0012954 [Lamprotornis superbus]